MLVLHAILFLLRLLQLHIIPHGWLKIIDYLPSTFFFLLHHHLNLPGAYFQTLREHDADLVEQLEF